MGAWEKWGAPKNSSKSMGKYSATYIQDIRNLILVTEVIRIKIFISWLF